MNDTDAIIYINAPLQTYLDDSASGKPAPGGGSVSACVGALGAALVAMVCRLTLGKEKFADVEAEVRDLVAKADGVRGRLETLLQEDTVAYNRVMAAYGMPKETSEEKTKRKKAIQDGLLAAASVPLDITRAAVEVCRLAKVAAEVGNPGAVTDAGIGAILGEAAAQGGALNVFINLGSIEDGAFNERTRAELGGLLADASSLRAQVMSMTYERI